MLQDMHTFKGFWPNYTDYFCIFCIRTNNNNDNIAYSKAWRARRRAALLRLRSSTLLAGLTNRTGSVTPYHDTGY